MSLLMYAVILSVRRLMFLKLVICFKSRALSMNSGQLIQESLGKYDETITLTITMSQRKSLFL